MISTDLDFIIPFLTWLKDNPLTVALVFFVLGSIAKATPWVVDDKILTFIKGIFQLITPGSGITVANIKEKYKLPEPECKEEKTV